MDVRSDRLYGQSSFDKTLTLQASATVQETMINPYIFFSQSCQCSVQVGPSGRGTQFVDIKLKVLLQNKLLIEKRNLLFQCQQKVVHDQMDHLVSCSIKSRVGEYLRYSIERYRRYSPFLYFICI